MLRSERVAMEDASLLGDAFADGTRPVIRWIKGDGLDDPVTRAAIGQATRIFGMRVDYCLCTVGIDAERARDLLAWAAQPVEWRPVSPDGNRALADLLDAAGCPPERFGYWWKWFPARVRPNGPEWILDGDMVVTGEPEWFERWAAGEDLLRVSQDDRSAATGADIYGQYGDLIDGSIGLYSGLISLPPGVAYMDAVMDILQERPLSRPHDGIDDMSEQGVVAAAFERIGASPIPLADFPFARAFEDSLDFGLSEEGHRAAWGYHFGHAFRRDNPHFDALTARGEVFSPERSRGLRSRLRWRRQKSEAYDRYRWLGGGNGQWGVPGWGMQEQCVLTVLDQVARFAGADVLDLGTSRGRLAGMMDALGCRVTTVDHVDRGAAANLEGLPITVVLGDAVDFLMSTHQRFDLICVDLHGNTPADWAARGPGLMRCLKPRGSLLVSNVELWKIPEWIDETGAQEFIESLGRGWTVRHLPSGPPGVAIARRRR
jgi:SAM-dependent methyltransferase